MNNLIFLFIRRMRAPLLVLISAYAISIGGLVLMPGQDPQGNPWRFDFFHAFYFVSFMGSTIGFGEIPYPFSEAQRLWTTVALYICVIAWLYAIGSILALVQDPAFRRVVSEQRFTDQVRHLSNPFYLVCGFGETGNLLVKALSARGLQSVVIDNNQEAMHQLTLSNHGFDIPSLYADAREVRHLIEGGLKNPRCQALIALTSSEEVNVKIAITGKLLRPKLPVICRANTQSTAANLKSFNTDHIINPFKVFADHLAMALREPSVHLLYRWLISNPGSKLPSPIQPPRGTWIVCGFGRFGREVHRYLEYEGVPTVVIEPDPEQAPAGAIVGRGTEAVTLREAGIDKAVGLVAGADQDINNLSIVMTAKELNPGLYLVARQNRRANDEIFRAADLDLVMDTSRILVMRILPLLTAPLLGRFLLQVRHRNRAWAESLLERILAICNRRAPQTWSVTVDAHQTPALHAALLTGRPVTVGDLLQRSGDKRQPLDCILLMLERDGKEILLPEAGQSLAIDDQLLFCASTRDADRLEWILNNDNVLNYTLDGTDQPHGTVWRWLERRWGAGHAPPVGGDD